MLRLINDWLIAGGGYRRLTIFLCLLFGVSGSYKTALLLLARRIQSLIRNNGNAFAIAYLKECVRLVYLVVAGEGTKVSIGPPFVGVRQGLPALVPSVLRSELLEGHRVFTMLTLSLLGTYRGLVAPPKVKLESITDAFTGEVEHFVGFSNFVSSFVGQLQLPKLGRPTLWLSTSVGPHGLMGSVSAIRDAAALLHPEHRDLLSFWCAFGRAVYGKWRVRWLLLVMRYFSACHWVFFRSWSCRSGVTSWISRLHRIEEAAGKVRIVAITDYWTQVLLRPIHSYVFAILRTIPQDGTFDQEASVERFRARVAQLLQDTRARGERHTVYSYDLSSATDRVPLHLYQELLSCLFGGEAATLWKHLLTARKWWDRDTDWSPDKGLQPVGGWKSRLYAVGQPMGAYSSWAMLALAHHAIVQYCAHLEGIQGWFEDYVIVGDDVSIAHESVANRYLAVMTGLGIGISMEKSIVSQSGVFEFCKRLVTPAGDVTGLAVKLIYQLFRHPLGACSVIRHLHRRGFALFPIAVARAITSISGRSVRFDKPIQSLLIDIRVAIATLVQPAFPWWRGIWLLIRHFELSVEELETILRTGRKIPSDELGAYGKLETAAFEGWLGRLRPGNWTRALETVPDGVDRFFISSDLLRWIWGVWKVGSIDRLVRAALRWGTPLGWWLMGNTVSQLTYLLQAALAAWRDTVSLPGTYTVAWRLIFLRRRIRDRVIEWYRGNSLEYLTAVTRARTRSQFNFTFSADANLQDRVELLRSNWVVRKLRKFPGTLPEFYPDLPE